MQGMAGEAATTSALGAQEFAALMAPLGPFGRAPRLMAGVSGGPHSLCLALLAADWARARGGALQAVVVDHGLRPESAAEADGIAATLRGALGIAAQVVTLHGLPHGAGLQEAARAARLAALLAACRAAGTPWLLLGHHRGDQAETLLQRAAAASGPAGLAAMALVRPAPDALVLRPLLTVPPARLEATLARAGLRPVRDPSNADPRFARIRLRRVLDDPGGTGAGIAALAAVASAFRIRRERLEAAVAARLADAARLLPEGWAELDLPRLGADAVADAALAALLRAVGGGRFAPSLAAVAALRRRGEGTLGGAWLRAPEAGAPWRLVREPHGLPTLPLPARQGAVWDGRFRLLGTGAEGMAITALGRQGAARLRPLLRPLAPDLPAAVLAALPALRPLPLAWDVGPAAMPAIPEALLEGDVALAAVPPLFYPGPEAAERFAMVFAPTGGSVTGS